MINYIIQLYQQVEQMSKKKKKKKKAACSQYMMIHRQRWRGRKNAVYAYKDSPEAELVLLVKA